MAPILLSFIPPEKRERASLSHYVPVVLDVVCQLIRLNVPETGVL